MPSNESQFLNYSMMQYQLCLFKRKIQAWTSLGPT